MLDYGHHCTRVVELSLSNTYTRESHKFLPKYKIQKNLTFDLCTYALTSDSLKYRHCVMNLSIKDTA